MNKWQAFKSRYPGLTQFLVFFMLSNGITLVQLILMPVFKAFLLQTDLVHVSFQILPMGQNFNGTTYYIFDYPSGLLAEGGGGGLAYFLAIQITLTIAQIINFFAQRKVTFKSTGSIRKAAAWYLAAYILITLGAAALQGLYKAPVYHLLITTWNLQKTGETMADLITMLINCAVSFWIYFPILKWIFKE